MLIEEVRNHLNNVIIPFWKSIHDDVYGGYYGYVNYDLKVNEKAIKGCILNSRILWFFSNAYKLLKDESLLKEANHAYTFLKEHCIDKTNGGVYWSLNYDGTVYDNTKHTYNQAFAVYALSSYYEISKKTEAIELAWSIYDVIEDNCLDINGYKEAFNIKFEPVNNDKLSENGIIAEKTMNTLLHVFEAYTELYRVTEEEKIKNRLRFMLDIFMEKIYNPEKLRQDVFFDKDWNSLIDLQSYGHDIETAWLLDCGLEVLNDVAYTKRVKPIISNLTQIVYERAYVRHSLLNECENGVNNTSRIWWVQAEAIVGFLNGYQNDMKKKEYMEAVISIWNFIKQFLVDKRKDSEWFWEVNEDGNPTSKKPIVEPWKCPYHNGRMCLEIIRRNIDAA
nr:AGE family epimerase/isomerase [uncultured Anaerocolumna sp.]